MMQVRYLGFSQKEHARAYQFEVFSEDTTRRRCTVTADLRLLGEHRVALQDGPAVCAQRLGKNAGTEDAFELTSEDISAYRERSADQTDTGRRQKSRKAAASNFG
jgi:hypothetical protein